MTFPIVITKSVVSDWFLGLHIYRMPNTCLLGDRQRLLKIEWKLLNGCRELVVANQ